MRKIHNGKVPAPGFHAAHAVQSLFALAMLLLMAACQGNIAEPPTEPINPALPGNASPNGGNEPGVEFDLTTPVISIGGATATTRTDATSRATATVALSSIANIVLYVDLLKADGTATQSCHYQYADASDDNTANGTWTVNTQSDDGQPAPLRVNGGNGVYYMRTTAHITTFVTTDENRRYLYLCYAGTATVTGDQTAAGATFAFAQNLSPYTAAVEARLTDANGNEIISSGGSDGTIRSDAYDVYPRGMAITTPARGAIGYKWTPNGTRPVRCSANAKYTKAECLSRNGIARYTAVDVLPGSVPGCWPGAKTDLDLVYKPYKQGDDYTGFLGDTDGKRLLFSIYQRVTPGTEDLSLDATTGLPDNADGKIAKTYHVVAPTTTAGIIGYTLLPGKLYRFNINLGGKAAHIVSIDVSDFVPAGAGDDIDIDNRPTLID